MFFLTFISCNLFVQLSPSAFAGRKESPVAPHSQQKKCYFCHRIWVPSSRAIPDRFRMPIAQGHHHISVITSRVMFPVGHPFLPCRPGNRRTGFPALRLRPSDGTRVSQVIFAQPLQIRGIGFYVNCFFHVSPFRSAARKR